MRIQISRTLAPAAGILLLLGARTARADDAFGAPPPEAKALVAAPKTAADAPKQDKPLDETNATISAGGQIATGNSKLVAGTVNGKFDMRRDANGFGTSLIGNYGEGGKPNLPMQTTVQNLQLRARYDRYLIDRLSLFLIGTGRHDRFQGLDVRLNIDPGVKYLFVNEETTKLWGEAGYDFQYDVRREDARGVPDAAGIPQVDANGDPVPPLLAKTGTDNSGRLFLGFKHAFNKEVTFSSGLEYLQSFVHSERARLNFDALIAANVGGGFAVGAGFTARYDHAPLPGKEQLDTTTTFSLIYAFSDAAPPPPPAPLPCPCPCEPPPPPSPPAVAPAVAPGVAPAPVPPPAGLAPAAPAAPPAASQL